MDVTNQTNRWLLCLCILGIGLLFVSGSVAATGLPQPRAPERPASVEYMTIPSDASAPRSLAAVASIGMGDLVTQTFESALSSGWRVYDAISPAVGLDYYWGTTSYTRAEGAHSALAVCDGRDGATLTETASYTAAVDSWMVYGPVRLTSAWQAQLDFWYYFSPTTSGALSVAVSTDFSPISLTGTFSGVALAPATGWTTGTLPLSAYAGQTIYVAFRYQTSDGGNAADGPFVDDVHVRANYRSWLPLVIRWMLGVSKSASRAAWPGQSLVYTITVHNRDTVTATGVMISDTIPASTTFVTADGAYSYTNRVVSWPDLTVPPGGDVVRHLTVAVPADAPAGFNVVNKDYAISVPPDPMAAYGPPVTSTTPFSFFDDFSNPASGWPVHYYDPSLGQCPPPGPWTAAYLPGGEYGISAACAWNGIVVPGPVRIADPAYFTIEVDLRSNQDFLWMSSYGIFFNASEDLRQMYIVRLFQGLEPPEYAVYRWQNFQGSSNDQPPPIMLRYGTCYQCNGADYAWNRIAVRRRGARLEVWMGASGGYLVPYYNEDDSTYMDDQHLRVGVHQGNFEWGWWPDDHIAYVFDNFKLSLAIR